MKSTFAVKMTYTPYKTTTRGMRRLLAILASALMAFVTSCTETLEPDDISVLLEMPVREFCDEKTVTDSETGEKLTTQTSEPYNGYTTVEARYAEGALAGNRKRDETFKDGERISTTLYFYDAQGRQTHAVTESKNGSKVVSKYYTEGEARGKLKSSEEFNNGKPVYLQAFYFDSEGWQTHAVYLWSKSGGEQAKFRSPDWDDSCMSVQYNRGRITLTVAYKNDILDDSNEMVLPEPLPPIPATSGYDTKNITLTAALSDDGNSFVITLKNISDSPVEVHENVFNAPLFNFYWRDNNGIGKSWQVHMGGEKTMLPYENLPHSIAYLAPSESLRYTVTIREIFQKLRDAYGQDMLSLEKSFADAPLKAEICHSHVVYWNLFPLPPEVERLQTTVHAFASLGMVEEFKKKHPELFKMTHEK